ncbi:hypothetical protein EDB84DRAFT_1444689 [Lactarius hengduanensis]|nr:hypothetical protein EDB84DRAFT_1444689 [Lactarius hengduanensis]
MMQQLDCLIKLQQHLACNRHSILGERGHKELTYEDLTLWAKHMLLGKATIHTSPNVNKFDHRPAKRGPSHLAHVNDNPLYTMPLSVMGPIELLASFGGLGRDLALHFHQFCENLFIPLGLVETRVDNLGTCKLSQQEVVLQDLEERVPKIKEVLTDEVIKVSDGETIGRWGQVRQGW